jgi:hypothetical protein
VREATTRIELARYGRLWWDVDAGVHPAFATMGSPGQLVLVVPGLRLVVAIQSRPDNEYGWSLRCWLVWSIRQCSPISSDQVRPSGSRPDHRPLGSRARRSDDSAEAISARPGGGLIVSSHVKLS